MKPISSGEMAPATAPRKPVTEKAMPRMSARHDLGDHHRDGDEAADDERHGHALHGHAEPERHVEERGHEQRRAHDLAHAGQEHRRALVAVADPVDDAARHERAGDGADEDEHAGEPGRAAGPQRGVALVERGRPEPEPRQRARRDGRADHQRAQRRHPHRHPHVAQQRRHAGVALRRHRRLHGQRRLRLLGGHVALAPARLGQPPHDQGEQRAGHAHQEEGPAPAEQRRHPAGDAQPERLPEERRGPLEREGAPADIGRVVVGEQRLRRRVVDRLADAERGPHAAGTARSSARAR